MTEVDSKTHWSLLLWLQAGGTLRPVEEELLFFLICHENGVMRMLSCFVRG